MSRQHGDRGLPHYAALVPLMPVEIYPAIKGLPSDDRLFVGFEVDHPESMMMELIEYFGGSQVKPAVPATASGIVTFRDPNGLLIRLFPKTQELIRSASLCCVRGSPYLRSGCPQ